MRGKVTKLHSIELQVWHLIYISMVHIDCHQLIIACIRFTQTRVYHGAPISHSAHSRCLRILFPGSGYITILSGIGRVYFKVPEWCSRRVHRGRSIKPDQIPTSIDGDTILQGKDISSNLTDLLFSDEIQTSINQHESASCSLRRHQCCRGSTGARNSGLLRVLR